MRGSASGTAAESARTSSLEKDGKSREVVRSANLARIDVLRREELAVVRDMLGGVGDGLADTPVSVCQQLLTVAKERPRLARDGAGDRDHARQPAH